MARLIWGLLLAWIWCSGCSILDQDADTNAPIQTNHTHYEAQRIEGSGPSGVQVTIPMTFRNVTARTVYFVGCRRPPMPILQKRVLGTWVTAWEGIELLCLSPPWEVEPGGTLQDTLQLRGYWPDQNAGPEFLTEVPGRYRLLRAVHKAPDPLSPLIPEAARVSNEFELTW